MAHCFPKQPGRSQDRRHRKKISGLGVEPNIQFSWREGGHGDRVKTNICGLGDYKILLHILSHLSLSTIPGGGQLSCVTDNQGDEQMSRVCSGMLEKPI